MDKVQRLLLINQFKILAKIEPESADYYNESAEILQKGYMVFYDTFLDYLAEEIPEKDGEFVLDILDFYCSVESFKSKPGNNLNGLKYSEFLGFDGNNEYEYLSFARFLIIKQHKFSELFKLAKKTDNFNSHGRMLNKYKEIISRWKKECGNAWPTKREQFEKILNKED